MSAYWKDIFRTIKYGKKRFFSIMLIVALGVTMFTGIRAACNDLTYTADRFYDQQKLYDINVASTLGLTDADAKALAMVEGVAVAEGGYELSVFTEFDDANHEAVVKMIGKELNQPYVVEGKLPDNANKIAVNEMYVKHSGKSIGDTVVLTEEEVENQDPFLAGCEYTITAIINDPMDVNMRDGNVSWRSQGTVDYTFYLHESAFVSDIYTYIYLAVEGAQELQTYDDEYKTLISTVEERIIADVKEGREQERRDEIIADAYEEYYEAEAEVLDELSEAEAELADGRAELADGRRQLADGKKELADNETRMEEEFQNAANEIADGKAQIADARSELAANEQQIADGEAQLASVKEELAAQEAAAMQQIQDGFDQLYAAREEAVSALDFLYQSRDTIILLAGGNAEYITQWHPLYYGYQEVLRNIAEAEAGLATIDTELANLEAKKAETEQLFASYWAELDAQEQSLKDGKAQIEAGKQELATQEQTLKDGEATLRQEEADAKTQIADARSEIRKNEAKLADGMAELKEGEQEYQEGYDEAMTELADARAEIEDIDEAEWYIQTRSSLSGYVNVQSDADSIEGIGTFLAIIFFIVAVLISLTTMTRMVEEDRGMIGTYKALGFTNPEIRRKAVIYSASACIAGGIIGDIGGYVILPEIIIYIFKTMYTFPEMMLRFDFFYGMLGIVLFVAGVSGAAAVACNAILKQMPAILMRPQAPKNGSRIFLEKIGFIWSRMSFLNKVTARNLFRYKKRFLMTVFGIMGCTALLVCGFGIKNTVTAFMPKQYEQTYEYDVMAVSMAEDNEMLLSYVEDSENVERYINVQVENVKLKNEAGREETVQMIVVPTGGDIDPFIHLRLKDGSIVPLSKEGITVTYNVSTILEFGVGDTILMRDLALNEAQTPVAQIVENYLGNMVYVTEEYYEAHFKAFEANGVLLNLTDFCDDPVGYATALGEKDGVISCISTDNLKEDFSSAFALMNLVVYVVIVLAAGMAFVVLFTLATTNISERSRELATIKVLGFFDKEVHLYVNKETLILSVIGILVGLPVGFVLTYALGIILKLPGIHFDVSIFPSTYLIAAVIAFAFTIIVNQITNRLLDAIDPVEALKSVE
ncbi:MAG: FtsX-like permease family protein [Eubacterium sp.]|nr:FtsX-like permease family protein [Eubacterium sp.]